MPISPPTQKAIVDHTKGLPPNSLVSITSTPDQIEHWKSVKRTWEATSRGLSAFFSGQPILDSLEHVENIGLIKANVQRLIKLYELLFWGWEDIKNCFQKEKIKLPANTPGELFLVILTELSEHQLQVSLGTNSFSPQGTYLAYGEWKKLESVPKSKRDHKYNNKNRKLESKLRAWNPGLWQECRDQNLFEICLAICESSKDRDVKSYLKDFNISQRQYLAIILNQLHPSKRMNGDRWHKGIRTENP